MSEFNKQILLLLNMTLVKPKKNALDFQYRFYFLKKVYALNIENKP